MTGLPPLNSLPTSQRLSFRVPDPSDAAMIMDASTDPLIPLITSVVADSTEAQALDFVTRQQGRPAERQGWSLTIVDIERGEPIGNAFVSCRALELGGLDIGYWVAPAHRGRGYAAEALALLRDWAPGEFDVDRLTLYIDPENTPSLLTAERSGFRQEGMHDRFELVGDEFRPMTVWAYGSGPAEPTLVARLEYRMWLDGYRSDPRWFDHHLHDDFVEHGCSGKLWTLAEITSTPIGEIEVELPFLDQQARRVAADSWMFTYIAVQPDRTCRRMSLWQETSQGWRMRFHQGTPITTE